MNENDRLLGMLHQAKAYFDHPKTVIRQPRWAVPCKAKKLLALAIFVGWKLPFIHNDLQALIAIAILAGLKVANVFIYYFLVRS